MSAIETTIPASDIPPATQTPRQPPNKRQRRQDRASATLSRPFRSPFLTRGSPSSPSVPVGTVPSLALTASKKTASPAPLVELDQEISGSNRNEDRAAQLRAEIHAVEIEIEGLRLALERQEEDVRSSVDHNADEDREGDEGREGEAIEALTRRWKSASRDAAEVVFANVKERVEGMGGLRAWRQRDVRDGEGRDGDVTWSGKRGRGSRSEGDDDERGDNDEPGGRGLEDQDEDEGEDEEGFTMTAMLDMLNIDPKVLRYDEELMQWVD
ncbi:MAG: hypothetical protein M1825_000471 [Sarcosagium campestre]|nr:MAG: hypothetical protein M1825_000471 [Sarcosagium campestre]